MKTNTVLAAAVIVVLLVVTNYATFWATNKVGQIATLSEKLDKYEQVNATQAGALTDGPKAQ